MRGRFHPMHYAILALFLIGIGYMLWLNPRELIIPVVVFGLVFLLYKFPPGRLRLNGKSARPAARKPERLQAKPRGRKTVPFRVIEGGKEDDNLPKYH